MFMRPTQPPACGRTFRAVIIEEHDGRTQIVGEKQSARSGSGKVVESWPHVRCG